MLLLQLLLLLICFTVIILGLVIPFWLFSLLVVLPFFALVVLLEISFRSWLKLIFIESRAAVLLIVSNVASFLEKSSGFFVHVDPGWCWLICLRFLLGIVYFFILPIILVFNFLTFFAFWFLYLLRLLSLFLGSGTFFVTIDITIFLGCFRDNFFLSRLSIPSGLRFRFWFLLGYLFVFIFLLFLFILLLLLFFQVLLLFSSFF